MSIVKRECISQIFSEIREGMSKYQTTKEKNKLKYLSSILRFQIARP